MSKIKKRNKKQSINKKEMKKRIMQLCYKFPKKEFNYKQFSAEFKITDLATRQLLNVALQELSDDKYLSQQSKGKFKLMSKGGYAVGIVDMTQKGHAYVVSDESDSDIFVAAPNLMRAMNGDKVKVYLYAKRKKQGPEGEVVEIIERAKTSFVGTIELSKNFAFLIPANKSNFDIFIPKEKLKGAQNGEKAIAKITEWPPHSKNPFGEIVDVLGKAGENETEMHAILAEFDLPYYFPKKVEAAAEKLDTTISKEEIKNRRDFRNIPTFTIDPADAKDFDDALSLQKLPTGNWEVGVHIADVSHYVQPGSIIDNEAAERGTSVYLVDRVVPMLPEKLSNGVCSLRPNEEKLTFSAVFEMDDKANIVNKWFGRTIINSDKRFAYEEAQMIIDTGEGEMNEMILTLNNLAVILREKRFNKGAISFERAEVKFELDDKGKPTGVYFKEPMPANNLIEEFMLLANKYVAELIGRKGPHKTPKTFVYRIHDRPDPDKLESFNNFIHKFGYGIQLDTPDKIARSMNNLLKNVKGSSQENVVSTLAVRAMAKAVYSTRNIGHYGLSFDYYTHFTSPIRRYPDLMVHRLLDRYLNGGRSASAQTYEDRCKHASTMEQRAVNAERTSIKYKQVEFLSDKIGEIFKGTISGVTDWGIYVELDDNKCEGMISIHSMEDDFYFFDEKNYCISGMHNDIDYTLGDSVTIKIAKANLEKKQLDFVLVKEVN